MVESDEVLMAFAKRYCYESRTLNRMLGRDAELQFHVRFGSMGTMTTEVKLSVFGSILLRLS